MSALYRKNLLKKDDTNRGKVTGKYLWIIVFFLGLALWILFNAFRNTVVHADKWNAKAQLELGRTTRVIQPVRGNILAADGSVLAATMQFYDLRVDHASKSFDWDEYTLALDRIADYMEEHFPKQGGKKGWHAKMREPYNSEKKVGHGWPLLRQLTYEEVEMVKHECPFFSELKRPKVGLVVEPVKRRRRPYGDMAQLSIGVCSEDKQTGEVHGMSGLEYALDSLLYGKPGINKKVNFTRGIGNWADTAAVDGWDVVSTIDIQMQDLLESVLLRRLQETRAEWGSAMLMEVATGDIKAISNLEEDSLGSGSGVYVEAMNRLVRGFEPGSVVKTLSMMVAVDDGFVTDIDSVIDIGGSFKCFGSGRPITDSHYNAQLTVGGVIEESSNIGMAKIMSRHYRSPQGFHDRIARLGFLEKLGSGIGEEKAARYPVVSVDSGGMTTLSRQFYGYGTTIPPLHTLSIYNAIANDGKYVRPRLVKGLRRPGIDSIVEVSYVRPQACKPHTALMMRQMLSRVVNGSRGTARSLQNPYVTLAGKTGTCYTVNPQTRQYDTSRKRLAFCGFFPADEPKYSCVVLIYHPRETAFGAASTSGVVFRDMAIGMYSRGMLGNISDWRDGIDTDGAPLAPLALASANGMTHRAVANVAGQAPRRMAGGDAVPDGVPDVRGMGVREAVTHIENAGLEVAFTGRGHVQSQQPPPGTKVSPGTKVQLHLTQ